MDWKHREQNHDQRPNLIKWRVISQVSRSRYLLDIVELSSSGDAGDIVRDLSRAHHGNWRRLSNLFNCFLFRGPVIELASLALVCPLLYQRINV